MHLFLFLPNGDIVLIAQTVVCFNFDQRWINACNCCYDLTSLWFSGGYYLMSCIKDVPTLRGDNYTEWRKKVDFAFVCAEVDWVLDTPQPVKPKAETANGQRCNNQRRHTTMKFKL